LSIRHNKLLSAVSTAAWKTVERAKASDNIFMIGLAVVIGLVAGFGAIFIRWLISSVKELAFGSSGDFLSAVQSADWWIVLLVPALGGLLVGPLIYFLAPEAKGHGVPEVIQAILQRGGIIRPRVAAVKALASAVTIGTGGSVGREGPIIQIGSSLGSTVGQIFKLPSRRLKTLVGCGAAAGIAAAFNAPIAGALFAIEIILMDFAAAQFTTIVIASVTATVVSHSFHGDYAEFTVNAFRLKSAWEAFFYIGLGLASGIVAYIFIKVLYYFEELWDNKIRLKSWAKPAVGGLIIGAVGLIFPEVLSVGYESMDSALQGEMLWNVALALIFMKILAMSMTLGSGGSGGVFAPSLFVGTMLGTAFGYGVGYVFPDLAASPGAYATVAMGGMVAGTARAPITAIVIVFELTKQNSIILPLMITCTVAYIISSRLSRESIYTLKLLSRKIKLSERNESNIISNILVSDILKRQFVFVVENMTFQDVVSSIIKNGVQLLPVLSIEGKYRGSISFAQIRDYLFEKDELSKLVLAGDLADSTYPSVNPNNTCREAWRYLADADGMPVLDPNDPGKLLGMIWRKDIDRVFNRELEKVEIASDIASRITHSNTESDIRFAEGYTIAEIKVPKIFIGKSLAELKIRGHYGVDVLSIKHESIGKGNKDVINPIPSPTEIILETDRIIIAGKAEYIDKVKSLTS